MVCKECEYKGDKKKVPSEPLLQGVTKNWASLKAMGKRKKI